MAALHTDEIGDQERAGNTRKHAESSPRKQTSPEMGAAIQRLIPGRITRVMLLDLFDWRAEYKAIQSWRYGHHRAPQWAADLIKDKLAKRAAADLIAAAAIKPPIGKGWNKGAATLAAWRERKAREKEKAANEAAGNQKPD